jgi:hypothetical protein
MGTEIDILEGPLTCSVSYKYRPVVKPLVDNLVREAIRPASLDSDTITGVCDLSGREHSSAFVALQGDHWRKVFPEKIFGIHRLIPVILSELVSPKAGFVRPEAARC